MATIKSTKKAKIEYKNLVMSCNVNHTEIKMPFDYFPTEKEFQEVLEYITEDIQPWDQPILIDLTETPANYSPPFMHDLPATSSECNHAKVKCGAFYGGFCTGEPAANKEHHHVWQTCGFCMDAKTGCLPTGNSDEWVCGSCRLAQTDLSFCGVCSRFEECDDHDHCGRCQFVVDDEEIKDDEELSEDEETAAEASFCRTQDGYVKDGFVVSDSDSEDLQEETPPQLTQPRKRKCHIRRAAICPMPIKFQDGSSWSPACPLPIQSDASRSFHDTQWDLMNENV